MNEKRDWTTIISLTIVGASAAVTSFSAQADLAGKAGWPDWMSWLLPATDDVYGVAATRIWLSANSSDEVRKHARAHAAGALLLSMAGNAMDHALSKGALHLGSSLWLLVVAVSLVPPIALGALMHLVTLRGRQQAAVPPATEPTVPVPDRAIERRTAPVAKPSARGLVEGNRTATVPSPSQATEPTVPSTVPAAEPTAPTAEPTTVPTQVVTEPATGGSVAESQANQANTESGSDGSVPPELRPGVKAPDFVIAAARALYEENPKLTDRKLAVATRDHFGVHYAVIGRSACQTIIADAERGEATG